MAAKDELGRLGEQIAARYLEDQGLTVLSRNWRCSEGELDIVATDGKDTLVVCEVKTRSGTGFGLPAEAVTKGKRRKLRRLAYLWLASMGSQRWLNVQFDVVGIILAHGGTPQITHIAKAF